MKRFHSLIQRGSLEHGARLPAERVLAEQLKVSRGSVREAIRTLELQGLVTVNLIAPPVLLLIMMGIYMLRIGTTIVSRCLIVKAII